MHHSRRAYTDLNTPVCYVKDTHIVATYSRAHLKNDFLNCGNGTDFEREKTFAQSSAIGVAVVSFIQRKCGRGIKVAEAPTLSNSSVLEPIDPSCESL